MINPTIASYIIGKPYPTHIARDKFTKEGTLLNFSPPSGWELILMYEKTTQIEIQSIYKGYIELALSVSHRLPFVCAKIGQLPWINTVFHAARLVHPDYNIESELQLLQDTMGQAQKLTIALFDKTYGNLQALRIVWLEPEFNEALVQAIIETAPLHNIRSYEQALARVFGEFSTGDLQRDSITRFCLSGR